MNVIQGQMKYIVYNRVWPKKFLLFFQRTFFRGYLFWGCLRLTQVCVCVCACVCPLQVSAAFVWKVFASIVPFTLILVFGLAHDPALALIAGSNCFLLAKFFGWLPGSLLDTNPWSLGACWCARKFSIIPLVRIDCFWLANLLTCPDLPRFSAGFLRELRQVCHSYSPQVGLALPPREQLIWGILPTLQPTVGR